MIALRILFGMQDVQHFGKKLFDLSFFLVIAATFNPQLYVYLLFAYLSILFFSPNQITHYFIPILACLAVWYWPFLCWGMMIPDCYCCRNGPSILSGRMI